MRASGVERRRGRRIKIEAPLLIKRVSDDASEPFRQRTTRNLSLAGVYFDSDDRDLRVNDVLITSVSIPEPLRREFPFTRLAGRSRVVRVEPLPAPPADQETRGVALEFSEDFTTLTSIPTKG